MKSHRMQMVRNSVMLMGSLVITMGLGFILKLILPRFLGVERFGTFIFAESFPALFFMFLPLGISIWIAREFPVNPNKVREVLTSIIVLELVFAVVIIGVLWGALNFMNYDHTVMVITLTMGIGIGLSVLYEDIFKKTYIALNQVKFVSIVNVLVKVALFASVLGVLLIRPNLVWIAVCFIAARLLGIGIISARALRESRLAPSVDLKAIKQVVIQSLPFFIAIVFIDSLSNIDATMLSLLSNNSEVGYFGAANQLIVMSFLVIPIIHNAVSPILAQLWASEKEEFAKIVREILRLILAVSLPLAMILILFGNNIVGLFYGQEFLFSVRIVCFLAPTLILTYVNSFLGLCLTLTTSGKKLAGIMFMTIVLAVIFDGLVIPYGIANWGVGGAGASVAMTTVILEFFMMGAFIAIFPIRLLDRRLIVQWLLILGFCVGSLLGYSVLMAWPFWMKLCFIGVGIPAFYLTFRIVTVQTIKRAFALVKGGRYVE